MPLSFQAHITPALARQATAGIFWRQLRDWKVLGAVAAMAVGMGGVLRVLLPELGWLGLGLFEGLTLASMGLAAWLVCGKAMEQAAKNFERFQDAPAEVRLAEGAYFYSAPWGRDSIEWRDFQSLWRFEKVWVLLQHKEGGVSVLLPTEALDDEARSFLLLRLAEAKVELR